MFVDLSQNVSKAERKKEQGKKCKKYTNILTTVQRWAIHKVCDGKNLFVCVFIMLHTSLMLCLKPVKPQLKVRTNQPIVVHQGACVTM